MLFDYLPYELNIMILMHLDIDDICMIGEDKIPEYVLERKKHKTLREAAEKGNLIGVKYLIDTGIDKGDINYALHASIIHGNLDIVWYLIKKHGANVHGTSYRTLQMCILYGYLDVVKYLIEKLNINITGNATTGNSFTILLSAANGHIEMVKYLVEHGSGTIRIDSDHALLLSANRGHLSVVKYLVEKCGANIHAYGNTILTKCYKHGHQDIVEYLLEHWGTTKSDNYEVQFIIEKMCKVN